MSDNIVDDADGLTIAFDGPRGPTQLHFSNELLTGPIEKFISHLQAADFGFDPSRAEDLREYLIARRNGNGGVLANYEFRDGSARKDAVTPAVHSSGIAYSKLDVEKALRIKAAEKVTDDGDRFLTLGEARQALSEIAELPYASAAKYVLEAAQQTKAGHLFVIESLPREIVEARYDDADDAIKRGVLRAPFPATFVLMNLEGPPGVCLLGIFDSGFVDDGPQGHGFSFWAAAPCWLSNGEVDWDRSAATGSYDFDAPFVIISLIADSRSSVTRIEADDKLNKARIKRGKALIPPYWNIEPPKPTVLVPNATSTIATKPKGGTHASPRPHDRRGHPRHLKSGRTVWVRDCKINALIPHLTRDRLFYEVRL